MLYFPMFRGYFPDWFPIWGGERFLFFRPVFNIADSAITVGVLNILFFQRSFFQAELEDKKEEVASESETTSSIDDSEGEITPQNTAYDEDKGNV